MKVERPSISPAFTSGVYFAKAVSLNKVPQLNKKIGTRISENGYQYIEDTTIPKHIKVNFLNNNFIKKISEKSDTFITYYQAEANKKLGSNFISMAKIWWTDSTKTKPQYKGSRGTSKTSMERAVVKMFKELA